MNTTGQSPKKRAKRAPSQKSGESIIGLVTLIFYTGSLSGVIDKVFYLQWLQLDNPLTQKRSVFIIRAHATREEESNVKREGSFVHEITFV